MNVIQWLGMIIGLIGVIMLIFSDALGPKFCNVAKKLFKETQCEKEMRSLYDESQAPRIFRFLGKIHIAQGVVIVFAGLFL